MVSKILVLGHFAPLFLDHGETEHHSGETAQFMDNRKKREYIHANGIPLSSPFIPFGLPL
jgi:hypothetical protein